MHPFARYAVIALVALIVAGALVALAILGRDSTLSVLAVLLAGIIGIGVGGFIFAEGWIWSQRSWRVGAVGRGTAIAIAGGLGIVLAGVAAAGVVILVLTFFVG
jgi:hypothetical protein